MVKLVRSPDFVDAADYATSEKRYSVVLRADVVASDISTRLSARVVNISAGGLMLVIPEETALSGHVALTIRHLGHLAGRVVWTRGNCVGVQFDAPIDPEKLITERAERASEEARATGSLMKKNSGIFDVRDDEAADLPFIAMMRSKGFPEDVRGTA